MTRNDEKYNSKRDRPDARKQFTRKRTAKNASMILAVTATLLLVTYAMLIVDELPYAFGSSTQLEIDNQSHSENAHIVAEDSDMGNDNRHLGHFTTFADEEHEKRVIIMYDESVITANVAALSDMSVSIHRQYHLIPGVAATITPEHLEKLRLQNNIVGVFEDSKVTTFLDDSVPQINANEVVPAYGLRGQGVSVCIVDTGVDDTHPFISQLSNEIDFVNNDYDAFDDNGHGTHVAGIVASNGVLFEGVAPGTTLMAAKVLDAEGSGRMTDVISGIQWCVDNNADIISMSLGVGLYANECDDRPVAIASNNAVNAGVVVIAASGNDGSANRISEPACASNVIAVGAVNDNDGIAGFSNRGHLVDVVAPGVLIESTLPGSSFGPLTGTSMATPHVSGTAAILLQVNPALMPHEVRDILHTTAADLGYAGFDNIFAHGRIDAHAANEMVLGISDPDVPATPPMPDWNDENPGNPDTGDPLIFSMTDKQTNMIRNWSVQHESFLTEFDLYDSGEKIILSRTPDKGTMTLFLDLDGDGELSDGTEWLYDQHENVYQILSRPLIDSNQNGWLDYSDDLWHIAMIKDGNQYHTAGDLGIVAFNWSNHVKAHGDMHGENRQYSDCIYDGVYYYPDCIAVSEEHFAIAAHNQNSILFNDGRILDSFGAIMGHLDMSENSTQQQVP